MMQGLSSKGFHRTEFMGCGNESNNCQTKIIKTVQTLCHDSAIVRKSLKMISADSASGEESNWPKVSVRS